MNTNDRKAINTAKNELKHLYEAIKQETAGELEVRILNIQAALEFHLSKAYAEGLCDQCKDT